MGEKHQQSHRHIPALDGVRGLAVLVVFLCHYGGGAQSPNRYVHAVGELTKFGWCGVTLFFVLSGFLITGILWQGRHHAHWWKNFYVRRCLRIFPLYYFVLAILFLVIPAVTTVPPALEEARRHQAWLWTYTANFFLAAKASWALTYVSHFWSLAIEEHFYLLWPLVVFSFRRETLERICLWVIGAALALRIALSLAGVSELSISVLTPCRVDTLCVGALLACLAWTFVSLPASLAVILLAACNRVFITVISVWSMEFSSCC